jgi:nitroreductase
MADHDLYGVMQTTRAVRKLRPDPIPDDVLRRVLQAATWGPSGGNRQPWRILAVRDAAAKKTLQELYQLVWTPYAAAGRKALANAPAAIAERSERALVAAAVQNALLACCAEGLGCVLTTLLCAHEAKIRPLLEIPEPWATAAFVPIGYPVGRGHGPLNRRPVEEMVFADRWGRAFPG